MYVLQITIWQFSVVLLDSSRFHKFNFDRNWLFKSASKTAIVDVVISQFSSNTTTENLIEVEEVFGVGDFVFFAGQFLWRLALLARAG